MLTSSTNSTERQMAENSFCITPVRLYKQAPLDPKIGDFIPVRIIAYNSYEGKIICNDGNKACNYFIQDTNFVYSNNMSDELKLKAINRQMGKKVLAKVVSQHEDETIELDRTQVLKQTTEILANEISKNVTATVEKIWKYGIFIDIGNGVTSFLHVTNISKSRYSRMTKYIDIGDTITVKLMDFDPETLFFSVSRKDAYPKIMFGKNEIVPVIAINPLGNEGYFVEYDPGNTGIMDVPTDLMLNEGQRVFCQIKTNKEVGFKCRFIDYDY